MKTVTYKDLLKALTELTPNQLSSTVIVYVKHTDEHYSSVSLELANTSQNVLDRDHPIITYDEEAIVVGIAE